jgi:hypothetical protein
VDFWFFFFGFGVRCREQVDDPQPLFAKLSNRTAGLSCTKMSRSLSSIFVLGGLMLSSFGLIPPAAAAGQYGLVDTFKGSSFFDSFSFSTDPDLTHGFVFSSGFV